MNSVGIDLHRNRSHVAVIDGQGELSLSRRIVNDRATFLELLGELEGESRIAVEATYGWEWLAELLEDAGYEIHLAHPLRTRAIAAARVKTDAVDEDTRSLAARRSAAGGVCRSTRAVAAPDRADRDALGLEEPCARDPRQARHHPPALRPLRRRRPPLPRQAT